MEMQGVEMARQERLNRLLRTQMVRLLVVCNPQDLAWDSALTLPVLVAFQIWE